MKTTGDTIDRGTLLVSGGTAALATLLMGATKGRPKKVTCCDPIDLTYTTTILKRKKTATSIQAVKLVANLPPSPTPSPPTGWKTLGLIASAKVDGKDLNGPPWRNQPLDYGIWVYFQ